MKLRSVFLCLFVAAILSGCVATSQGVPRPPEMTFDNFHKVELDVARINVRNAYRPPMKDPHIEHLFPTPPYAAVEHLVKKQLVAAGDDRVLNVIIDDASVVREELTVQKGLWNVLTREPDVRLKAKVLLRFELVNPKAPDIVLGHAEVMARRTRTLLEGTSVADRDRAYFDLTEDLMDDLNDGLRTVVKNTFGKK